MVTGIYLFLLATVATWLWSTGRAGRITAAPGAHHQDRRPGAEVLRIIWNSGSCYHPVISPWAGYSSPAPDVTNVAHLVLIQLKVYQLVGNVRARKQR